MFTTNQTLTPILSVSDLLDMPPFISNPNIELYQYWNLSQWWQRYTNPTIPTRLSRIFFFYLHPHAPGGQTMLSDEEAERQRREAWHVVQYYTTSSLPLSHKGKVFSFQLRNPPTVLLGELGFPLMGASFNHLAWIEETRMIRTITRTFITESVRISKKWPWVKYTKEKWEKEETTVHSKRVLRLVAFPEPGVSPDEEFTVHVGPTRPAQFRTLEDVPESVLDKAVHIFLEPAMAAVLITTSDNEMHRFNYA